jgi:HEAT repeat protein
VRPLLFALLLFVTGFSRQASAQVISPAPSPPPTPTGPRVPRSERVLPPAPPLPPAPARGLRDHFGIDLAAHLLRSNDPDERLRGLERVASIGSPEAVSMLVHAARDPAGSRKVDTRALLLIVRGLADKTAQSEVRQFLKDGVLGSLGLHAGTSAPEADSEGEGRDGRLALARAAAALALATSPDPRAVDALMMVARDSGPGQAAAADALAAFPPEKVATAITGPLTPALLRLAAALGDLRALDAVRAALQASDATTRIAALDAMAAMGDARGVAAASPLRKDPEPRVREAAVGALVRLVAPERFRAVEELVGDETTAREGARLAGLAADGGVAKALAARAMASADPEVRSLALFALGRCEDPLALQALVALVKDPLRAGDAAAALARSPAPGAEGAIEMLLGALPTRRLGARAYVVRAATLDGQTPWGTDALEALAASRDAKDRSVGLSGLVLLGRRDALQALTDPDPTVRRAVAVAAINDPRESTRVGLLRLSGSEKDPLTRRVERAALAGGDPEGLVTGTTLTESLLSGEADGPLAAMTLATRAVSTEEGEAVDALLVSSDPILRAHVARGLGESSEAGATGRLARAYELEVDPLVRRAVVLGLARRTQDADSPARVSVLRIAARLDPDRAVRESAGRALAKLPAQRRPPSRLDVAWIRLASPAGEAPPEDGLGGALLRADGIAVPVAFDSDGYALVPIVPGEARLLLAPRVPAYDVSVR